MVARARQLCEGQGLRNVTFEQADAQVHPFPSEHFDLALSRFGTMFFDDPVAAFVNIGRAVRAGGRLVMMVWQNHDANEWSTSIQRALASDEGVPPPVPAALDPFSLADQATVERILEAASFADVTFTDVHEPVYYGRDITAALDWIRGFTCTNDALKRLDPASVERAVERLRETIAAHGEQTRCLVRLACLDRESRSPLTGTADHLGRATRSSPVTKTRRFRRSTSAVTILCFLGWWLPIPDCLRNY